MHCSTSNEKRSKVKFVARVVVVFLRFDLAESTGTKVTFPEGRVVPEKSRIVVGAGHHMNKDEMSRGHETSEYCCCMHVNTRFSVMSSVHEVADFDSD